MVSSFGIFFLLLPHRSYDVQLELRYWAVIEHKLALSILLNEKKRYLDIQQIVSVSPLTH